MPLIDLQTDLRSLKYGDDRRGGGSSGQPFIKSKIPSADQESTGLDETPGSYQLFPEQQSLAFNLIRGITSPFTFAEIARVINTTSDFFNRIGIGNNESIIRGGFSSIARSTIDSVRLVKYLASPKGLIFIGKQNLLSQTGVRTQGSGLLNEKGYTALSTVGQAAGNAFGLHLVKNGINPLLGTRYEPKPGRYLDNVDPLRNNDIVTSIPDDRIGFANIGKGKKANRLVALKQAIDAGFSPKINGISLNSNGNVLSYQGGPSTIGVLGSTKIRFADPNQRTGKNNPFLAESGFYANVVNLGGTSFDITSAAQGVSSYIQNKFSANAEVGRGITGTLNLLGFSGNATQTITNTIFRNNANNLNEALGLGDSIPATTNFHVFKRNSEYSTTLNFQRYVRLSNVYGTIVSDPVKFNLLRNAIKGDGDRDSVFDFNVYQGGNISKNNKELLNKNKGATWTQADIINESRSTTVGEIKSDFRKKLLTTSNKDNVKTVLSRSPNYRTRNFMLRTNVGDPGATPVTPGDTGVLNYNLPATTLTALNRITAFEPTETFPTRNSFPSNDLFTFRFAVVNNDNINRRTYVQFPAYINNFDDNYSATWGAQRYVGRGDNFYNYEGFDRQISFGFTVAAESKAELAPMYKKLNYLASTLAPDYSSEGYMRGNLIELTMGWYLNKTPGFLTSFNFTIPEDSPYEVNVGLDGGGEFIDDDQGVGELPLIINVQATFTPIHNFLVSKAANDSGDYTNNPNSKFISLTEGANSMYGKDYKKSEKYQSTRFANEQEETAIDNVAGTITDGEGTINTGTEAGTGNVGNTVIVTNSLQYQVNKLNTNAPNFSPRFNVRDNTSLAGGDTEITL